MMKLISKKNKLSEKKIMIKIKFVKRVVILSFIFGLSIVNSIFAKTYDLSKISNVRLVARYSNDATVEEMDTVTFGSYPQSDASGDTKDPIEWIVVDRKDDKLLLLSKYVLDCKCYNDDYEDVTWETCTLRKWLNFDFLNNAFNDNEQDCIIESEIVNHRNYLFNTSGGNNTIDKVFVLSSEELKLTGTILNTDYFMHKNNLETKATNYAKHVNNYGINLNVELNTVGVGRIGDCSYWLRTPANNQSSALSVGIDGWIEGAYHKTEGYDLSQYNVDRKDIGVRPAMWVTLNNNVSNSELTTNDNTTNNQKDERKILGKSINEIGVIDTDQFKSVDEYDLGRIKVETLDSNNGNSNQNMLGDNVSIEGADVWQNPDGKRVGEDGLVGDTINNAQTNAESIYSNDNRTNKTTSSNQNILGDNVHIEGVDVYQNPDGSIQIGGTPQEGAKVQDGWVNDTYYRNCIKVVNEWIDRINGSFITKNGEMTWFDNGRYYLGSDGLPEKSKWIGDYYVDDTGKLLTKTITPDGKRVDGTGKLIVNNSDAIIDENFTGLKDGWYYVNGVKQIDTWVKIDGYNYRFDKDGHNYILNPKDDSSNERESIDDNQQQETNIEDNINSIGKKTNDKNKVYYYAKQDSKNNKMYKTISKKKTKGGLFGTGFFNPFGEGILKKNNKTYYLIEMTLNDETTERLNRYADFSEQHYTFINAIEWVMLYGNTMNNLNVLMDNYGSISPATKDVSYAAPEIGDRYQNGKIQLSFEIESERDNVYNKIVNANVLLIATNNVIKSHDTVFYEEDELGNVSRFEYVEDDGSHVNFVTAYVDCEDRIVEYTSSHVGYQLYVKDGITDYIIHKEYIYEPITKFEKFDIFIMGHDSLSYAIQGNKISHLAEKGVSGMNKFRVYGGRIVEECELNTGKGFEDFEKYYVENKDKW